MREWRNWQTRTFEGRVVHTVRVQVPFLAPNNKRTAKAVLLLFHAKLIDAEPLRPSVEDHFFSKNQVLPKRDSFFLAKLSDVCYNLLVGR